MKTAIPLVLAIMLIASMLALAGCKGDEPAPDANETQLGHVEQPEQPKQLEQPKQTIDIAAAEKAAVEAAEAWLKILDSGKYAQARQQAALLFRNSVPQQQWETSLGSIRRRMGTLVSREVTSKKYMAEIPKAPPGPYVRIQYKTRFQHRTAAVEIVTPMLEKDGTWRVSGYYVK